jgi:hypothetical protein
MQKNIKMEKDSNLIESLEKIIGLFLL